MSARRRPSRRPCLRRSSAIAAGNSPVMRWLSHPFPALSPGIPSVPLRYSLLIVFFPKLFSTYEFLLDDSRDGPSKPLHRRWPDRGRRFTPATSPRSGWFRRPPGREGTSLSEICIPERVPGYLPRSTMLWTPPSAPRYAAMEWGCALLSISCPRWRPAGSITVGLRSMAVRRYWVTPFCIVYLWYQRFWSTVAWLTVSCYDTIVFLHRTLAQNWADEEEGELI